MDAHLDPSLEPHGDIPNTPLAVSLISFFLGAVFCAGLALLAAPPNYWWAGRELGFYIACWAGFHWGEFAVTAEWNKSRLTVDSFLLNNFAEYHYAHGVALFEYFVERWFWPGMKQHWQLSVLGMVITLLGQALRSMAMVHAAGNFSHWVETRRTQGHELVTTGVYAWIRHPSYAGFFYWALGTQIAMLSPVSFVGFWGIMYWFFSKRIRVEERFLVFFFGDEYRTYRQRVGSGVPFIR
ncbi:ICMT-domain-containing protein [Dacryopinax primogenitus]|uniref:Protein-S-isoprenylcysteine O-methyltransferase n=1 Tax=Dacryopinax primogenitus (strain DJM 731) TaxID=1858805 RepID=M5FZZ5_DACPD|nr:ICMT-domain-containing protein [Dacryopinax primogenitus]EJU01470.1 ICMT-domain-containing protein [Dacryopinax primogenitus]